MASSYTKTITLGLDTTSFNKSISDCNAKMKRLDAEMEHSNQTYEGNATASEKYATKMSILSEKIDTQKQKVEACRQKYEQLLNQQADTAKIDKAETALLKEENTLKELEQQYSRSGLSAQQFQQVMATLVTTLVAVGKALVEVTNKAAEYVDEVNTMASQSSASTDLVQTWEYMAERVDVSAETMSSAMSKLKKNMGENASSSATAAFQELGVSITDASGQLKSAQEVMYETFDALGSVENETQKDSIAMAIFGKSADDLAGAIDGGSAALQQYYNEAQATGAILDGDTLTALQNYQDEMDEAKAKTLAAQYQLGALLAEGILPLIQAFNNLDPSVRTVIVTLGTIAVAAVPVVAGIGLISTAMGVFTGAAGAGTVAATAFDVSLLPIIAVCALIVVAITAVVLIIIYLVNTIGECDSVPEFFEHLSDDVNEVTNGFINLKAAADGVKEIFDGIRDAVDSLNDSLDKYISNTQKLQGYSGTTNNKTYASRNLLIGHNAAGSASWRGGLTMVGEEGPELVNIPQGSRIYNNSETKNLGGNTYNISMNCDLNKMKSVNDVVKAVSGLKASAQMGGVC